MPAMLGLVGLVAAALTVAVMGFASQRGATCLVAALDELVARRRATRLASLAEAALWVSGGLIVARAAGLTMAMPADFALTPGAAIGGALLGAGAVLAGACAIGALARLGTGEWGYLAMPFGYFAGCEVGAATGAFTMPVPVPTISPLVAAPAWLAVPLVIVAIWRLVGLARRGGWQLRALPGAAWNPHAATVVIGLAFVFLSFLVGPWAYTEALKGLAMGKADSVALQSLLLGSLLAGSVFGAWRSGRFKSRRPSALLLGRAFVGGAIMAMGSLLIPGNNDGLILIGLPSLHAYAIVALVSMAATIAALQWAQRRRSVLAI